MLVKHAKPAGRKWLIRGALVAFVIEAGAFALSYYGWTKINTDRDTRKYLKNNYPSVLEAYYKTGEFITKDSRIRDTDQAYWDAETPIQKYPSVNKNPKQQLSKNEQLLKVLESASSSDVPFYRLSKEEIEKAIKK